MNAPLSLSHSPDDLTPLRLVIVGHVDHGKSTLVGRLFNDTGSLPEGKLEQLQQSCRVRGVPFEWAFLMDAFKAERDQNITIDTAQIWFTTQKRQVVIIDAPGHKEFLKNMVTGAASAHAALLLIAADEGVQEQSKRHATLLSLLGVKQVTVVVNKMDLIDHDQKRFDEIQKEYTTFLKELGVEALEFIPISARNGDNVAQKSDALSWHKGPSVLEAIDDFEIPKATQNALRFFTQDVYRFDERRIIAGRVESGTLNEGDELIFYPGEKSAAVKSIEGWSSAKAQSAAVGTSTGFTLSEQIFAERGQIATTKDFAPRVGRYFKARVFWMGGNKREGERLKLKLGTQEAFVRLHKIERVINASDLSGEEKDHFQKDDVVDVWFKSEKDLAFDLHEENPITGRFVLIDGYDLSGGGIILESQVAEEKAKGRLSALERQKRHQHRGAVLYLRASEDFAHALERKLFERNANVAIVSTVSEAKVLARAGLLALVIAKESDEGVSFLQKDTNAWVTVSSSKDDAGEALIDQVFARLENTNAQKSDSFSDEIIDEGVEHAEG